MSGDERTGSPDRLLQASSFESRKFFRPSKHPLLLLLSSFFLAACQPALVPIPRPTPAALVVELSPALQPLSEVMRACLAPAGNPGLVLLDPPVDPAGSSPAALRLLWGDSGLGEGYVTGDTNVIGQEELAVIVHPQNPLKSISLSSLRAIYSGAQRAWPGSALEIQPWVYLSPSDLQSIFEARLLGGQKPSTRVAYTAPDPSGVREAVSGSPAAIGFLPRRWLDEAVKALPVSGLDPSRLRQPILAWTPSEPRGFEKAWLLCLQEQLSK